MRFSVVIPSYARPRQLRSCVEALARLRAPGGGFEVVVVDDGSPQPLQDLVEVPQGLDLRWLRQENRGPGVARNLGIAAAKGEFIALTDDDCEPEPGWLEAFDDALDGDPTVLCGGRTTNRLRRRLFSEASQAILEICYRYFNPDPKNATFFASNNMAVARSSLDEAGGFDPAFRIASEDRELCDRWLAQERRMVFVPEARIAHAHDLSFWRFVRQHFSYGRGAVLFHRRRHERRSGKFSQSMTFHAALPRIGTEVLRQYPLRRRVGLAVALAVWQVANASGFFFESLRRGSDEAAP